MYLSDIRIWNFRKFGQSEKEGVTLPGVHIPFNEKLNVLIGENDAGKSAIVDSIRLVLGTQSREWFYIDESDFHFDGVHRADSFKIECCFKGFTVREAANFLEWIDIIESNGEPEYSLTVTYSAQYTPEKILRELRAGSDIEGASLPLAAQDLLRVIYLKPLRDAENELTPGRNSRLAQILKAHPAFHKNVGENHALETIVGEANKKVEEHFTEAGDEKAAKLLATINSHLSNFFSPNDKHESNITISGSALHDILQRLSLVYGNEPPGLGSLNLLYMAAELLLLQAGEDTGLRLTIIEELEAHLHPQAQLRLIKYLQSSMPGQLILTTHSTTLASSLKLESLIICKDGEAFPMGPAYTNLEPKHYDYLERFLDATKANLFFAKAVVMVEGDAENILLPTIAECLGRPLYQYGVSIVNVGSTAFLHYAKVFSRKDGQKMGIKAAIITDLDVKPEEEQKGKQLTEIEDEKKEAHKAIVKRYAADGVETFVSHNWTLEYEISLSSFAFQFLKCVFESEKIQNAKTGEPKSWVYKKCLKESAERWKKWNGDGKSKEYIADKIYRGIMLRRDDPTKNKISKAIVAQCFSSVLDGWHNKDSKKLRARLLCPELKYLSDAIAYVTEPIEELEND